MFHLVSSLALDLFGSEDEAEAHRELIHFQNAYPSDPRAFFSNKRARQVGTSVLQRLRTKFSSQDRIEDMWLLWFKNFQRPIEEFEELAARISVKQVKRPETTSVKICQAPHSAIAAIAQDLWMDVTTFRSGKRTGDPNRPKLNDFLIFWLLQDSQLLSSSENLAILQ